jgi:hypothetical protein
MKSSYRIPLPAIDQTENSIKSSKQATEPTITITEHRTGNNQQKYQQDKGSKVLRWYQKSQSHTQAPTVQGKLTGSTEIRQVTGKMPV